MASSRTRGKCPDELSAQFRDELADVFSHVLLLARHSGVDLEAAVDNKWSHRLRS